MADDAGTSDTADITTNAADVVEPEAGASAASTGNGVEEAAANGADQSTTTDTTAAAADGETAPAVVEEEEDPHAARTAQFLERAFAVRQRYADEARKSDEARTAIRERLGKIGATDDTFDSWRSEQEGLASEAAATAAQEVPPETSGDLTESSPVSEDHRTQ